MRVVHSNYLNKKNELTVIEAYTRDVGRGIARITSKLMDELGLSKEDIVEIVGKRRTVAKCISQLTPEQLELENMQLAQARAKLHKTQITEKIELKTKIDWTDTNTHIHMRIGDPGRTIRIDGLIRNNAGIAIGDTVSIRKIIPPQAEKVTVTPLENIPPIDERYIADVLESIPITKGDNVMIPYFGGRLTFQVTSTIPDVEAVLVIKKTIFSITRQGPTLVEVNGFKYYQDSNNISLVMEEAVRKETFEDNYLILKIFLHHEGFGAKGEFQIKLEKNMIIQQIVLGYKEQAEKIVALANKKLSSKSDKVNSADLVRNVKFEILEKWRTIN